MLPNELASSFNRYKEDTMVFISWLSQAAVACGYKHVVEEAAVTAHGNPLLKEGKLTGKARKQAKLAAEAEKSARRAARKRKPESGPTIVKHTMTTKDLLQQAELLSKSTDKKISVPAGLERTIRNAIDARKRCSAWFRTAKIKDELSNLKHEHFIKVLEKALSLVETHLHSSQNKKTSGADKAKVGDESMSEMRNRFQDLDVEDSDDEDDLEEPTDATQLDKTNSQPIIDVFELEEESTDTKMSLMIFCFFEDMHAIQASLHDVWKSYKNGETDLASASFMTNAAVELVRQMEEEILQLAPELLDRKRPYETIAMIIYFTDAFSKNEDPTEKLKSNESLRPSPFDDFIYLAISRTLMKLSVLVPIDENLDHDGTRYPMYPITPFRFNYLGCLEMMDDPIIQRREAEDEHLSQYFLDLFMYRWMIRQQQKNGRIPLFRDEFSKGLCKLKEDGIVSVWLVFASRIWLDIHEILGDQVDQGCKDLYQGASNINDTIAATVQSRAVNPARPLKWSGPAGQVPLLLHRAIVYWIICNPLRDFKSQVQDNLKLNPNPQSFTYSIFSNGGPEEHPALQCVIEGNTEAKFPQNGKWKKCIDDQKKSCEPLSKEMRRLPKAPDHLTFSSMTMQAQKDGQTGRIFEFLGWGGQSLFDELAKNPSKVFTEKIFPISQHEDSDFLYTHNPMWCGTMLLECQSRIEQAGLSLEEQYCAVRSVAHLYKAIQRAGFLDTKWPQMEKMIAIHCETIFKNKFPSGHAEALRSYINRINSHAKTPAFSEIMTNYFSEKESFEDTLKSTKSLVQEYLLQIMKSKHKRRSVRRNLTPQQCLVALRDYLPTVMPTFTFDYISMIIACRKLLDDIHVAIQKELRIEPFTERIPGTFDGTGEIDAVLTYRILMDAKDGDDLKLKIAAQVMGKYLEEVKLVEFMKGENPEKKVVVSGGGGLVVVRD